MTEAGSGPLPPSCQEFGAVSRIAHLSAEQFVERNNIGGLPHCSPQCNRRHRTDKRRQVAEQMLREFEMPTDESSIDGMLASPTYLFGTIEQIVEDLQVRRQRFGFSYIVVAEYFQADAMERFAPVIAKLAGI